MSIPRKCVGPCGEMKTQDDFRLNDPNKPHLGYRSKCKACESLNAYLSKLKKLLIDEPDKYWQCICKHIMNRKTKICTKCNKDQDGNIC